MSIGKGIINFVRGRRRRARKEVVIVTLLRIPFLPSWMMMYYKLQPKNQVKWARRGTDTEDHIHRYHIIHPQGQTRYSLALCIVYVCLYWKRLFLCNVRYHFTRLDPTPQLTWFRFLYCPPSPFYVSQLQWQQTQFNLRAAMHYGSSLGHCGRTGNRGRIVGTWDSNPIELWTYLLYLTSIRVMLDLIDFWFLESTSYTTHYLLVIVRCASSSTRLPILIEGPSPLSA